MTQFEKAAAPLPCTRRRRLGDGMMEPTRAMEIKDPVTGWFRLIPGVPSPERAQVHLSGL